MGTGGGPLRWNHPRMLCATSWFSKNWKGSCHRNQLFAHANGSALSEDVLCFSHAAVGTADACVDGHGDRREVVADGDVHDERSKADRRKSRKTRETRVMPTSTRTSTDMHAPASKRRKTDVLTRPCHRENFLQSVVQQHCWCALDSIDSNEELVSAASFCRICTVVQAQCKFVFIADDAPPSFQQWSSSGAGPLLDFRL